MRVVEHGSAAEFLARTEQFRAHEPVLTNIIGSVATGVASGLPCDAALWLTVHDDQGPEPLGIAMRTSPHNLVLSPMPRAAARVLGEWLAVGDPGMPGVSGPPEAATALLEGFGAGEGFRLEMDNKVRVLTVLQAPRPAVPGQARRVGPGDLELVTEWLVAFGAEADLHVQPTRDVVRAELQVEGAPPLWLWETGGGPVSLGGHAPLVRTPAGTVGRIGPIYTPGPQRRRGYGSAITHAIAEDLRATCQIVMLYTDASNQTSNSVYARLGFAEVSQWVELAVPSRASRR